MERYIEKNYSVSSKNPASISRIRQMLNKVPKVTIFFWIIKIMATTVGETAADLLNDKLKLGLTYTSLVMSGLLIITLFFQFRAWRYIPKIYWLTVVLISVVGTLVSDNLVDNLGVSLQTTVIIFSLALLVTFIVWYLSEKTISIHSIYTTKREIFYWLAILFTFALGTAGGDLFSKGLKLGYQNSVLIFAALIGIVAVTFYRFRLNEVTAFWIAYILARPLGVSLSDFLSQSYADGGLNLGTVAPSVIFLITILGIVVYLTNTRKDQTPIPE
jgi:uncharacterized membrane-anchored protein